MSKPQFATAEQGEAFCFDYTDYLSASCKKRWSFIDAIYGVIPIFGMVTRKAAASETDQEKLKALALQVLSTQVNDETNIIRLITLAGQQGLTRFDIKLPYALEGEQLTHICQEVGQPLQLTQQDERLLILLPDHSTAPCV
ncbi:hypothetical protein SGGMMB4_03351 [Sodalis glossinidius str. 'morsitans']|uniref:Uncharacterized protein n=1 Tax=Sodalis glossinidius (strain morsitans) TaxID=343509 RepID=Q2NSW0_SODGM|nr:hypothetical protein [Sodalis glossinidius]BAE74765.1 conserved hypothetical protein [Sodalis glossinidius str. 'morsitans']CRL45551.1 hypothetical protein SGGMMB4_03351 [Sodalis glossinidius str. 'morsitans']